MSKVISFKNIRVWDGLAQRIDHGIDALAIEDGVITFVGSSEDVAGDAQDMGGLTLIPGLIDAHIHLCLNPDIKDPLQQDLPEREVLLQQMSERALAMVRAGITTARDLGGGQWLELEVRDRINSGQLVGPRLLCAGQPITSPMGHCHFWGGQAKDDEQVQTVLQRQVDHQVDLIKVMATGGSITKGSEPKDAQFSAHSLEKIVQAANQQGFHVAAHCHGTSGINNAATAGVTTIEHCSWVGNEGWARDYDADAVNTIVNNEIWVSPTINSGWQRHIGNQFYEDLVKGNYAKMKQAGVRLIASTDAGIPNVKHHHLPLAIPVFAHFAQLTPVEALSAATSECASAIGLGEITGQIKKGYAADLLMFDGNPLDDLSILASPAAVFKQGVAINQGMSG